MKSNAIVRIVIWTIVTAALVGMLVLGLFPWLIRDAVRDNRAPAATMVPVPLETEVSPIQALPNEEEMTFPANVNEIEIIWVAGDIIIMENINDTHQCHGMYGCIKFIHHQSPSGLYSPNNQWEHIDEPNGTIRFKYFCSNSGALFAFYILKDGK